MIKKDHLFICRKANDDPGVRIADDRVKDGKDDKYDVNVSSIGHYPFTTMHQNSGIKMNGNWTSGSGNYAGVKILIQ